MDAAVAAQKVDKMEPSDETINNRKQYMEMLESEQNRIVIRYRKLSTIWSICEANLNELMEIIKVSSSEENGLALIKQDNRPLFENYMVEFIRRFINHVGSIYMFIEYSRREYKYLNSINKHITGYSKKIEDLFTNNELVQFINRLRNFCIHVSMPNFAYSFSFSTIEESKQFLYIQKKDLLVDKTWNKNAQAFIDKLDDKIVIEPLINQYYLVQKDFYEWFSLEYYNLCKAEHDYVNSIIIKVN